MSFRTYVSFFVLIGTLVTHGQEPVAPKIPVSLDAILLNARAFKPMVITHPWYRKAMPSFSPVTTRAELTDQDFPSRVFKWDDYYAPDARNETRELCQDLGVGCLAIGYRDPMITAFLPIKDKLSYEQLLGDEIFLGEMGRLYTCGKNKIGNRAFTCESKFKKEGWFKKQKDIQKDGARTALEIEKGIIQGQLATESAVEQLVFAQPASFQFLPSIYGNIAQKAPGKENLVGKAIEKALLLTLSALTNSANSRSITYAYGRDDLILKKTLLRPDDLYSALKHMRDAEGKTVDRWPKIVSLTPALRNQLKGFFLDRTTVTNQWKTQAVYLANENVILLDYTLNFFEALYTLQHELWHVAWEHSTFAQAYRQRLRELLDKNDPQSMSSLSDQMAYYTVQNERAAITQMSLLYHFSGHLTQQWSSVPQPSALAWHNSILGLDEIQNLFISRESRLDVLRPWHGKDPIMPLVVFNPVGPFILYGQSKKYEARVKKAEERFEIRDVTLSKMDEILKENLPAEMLFFAERYFVKFPNLKSLDEEFSPSKLTHSLPSAVTLNCRDTEKIKKALPQGWRYGFPFQFRIESSSPCGTQQGPAPLPEGNGTHPGDSGLPEGNGTHPGESGLPEGNGTHPGISGFPSINAGDTKK